VLANAIDLVIREFVGLVAQQLAPMRNRDRIWPIAFEIAALHGSRAFRTSELRPSVAIARWSAPTIEAGALVSDGADAGIDRHRSPELRSERLFAVTTSDSALRRTSMADRSAVVLLEHEAKIRSACIDAKRRRCPSTPARYAQNTPGGTPRST
jgi:hypothetical protein